MPLSTVHHVHQDTHHMVKLSMQATADLRQPMSVQWHTRCSTMLLEWLVTFRIALTPQ